MPRPLNEQTIVLTGASSGFGREAALIFGRKGANVVLAARDEQVLEEVAAEIEKSGGPEAYVEAWLDHAATGKGWAEKEAAARQYSLL